MAAIVLAKAAAIAGAGVVGVGNAAVFVVSDGIPAAPGVPEIAGTGGATPLRSVVGITMDTVVAVGNSVAISSGAFMMSVLLISSVLGVLLQSVLGLESDLSEPAGH